MRLIREGTHYRRASYRRRRAVPRLMPPATGTIKSLETPRGTGSIAPDVQAPITCDTGFDQSVVQQASYETLKVGDRVRFAADPDPERPGYAQASVVKPDPRD